MQQQTHLYLTLADVDHVQTGFAITTDIVVTVI